MIRLLGLQCPSRLGVFGVFAVITDAPGERIRNGQREPSELLTELPSGDYRVEVSVPACK